MAFVKRLINITFALGQTVPGDVSTPGPAVFSASGTNQVTLSGLRASVKILKAGGLAMNTAQLTIYGMDLSTMNELSTLGLIPTHYYKNSVLVEAGDEGGQMSVVFSGSITNAWVDFQGSPDVAFQVEAASGGIMNVTPTKPNSYNGPTNVATILESLSGQMGLKSFENSGVSTILESPYLYGAFRAQVLACVRAANCEWMIDDDVLAVWVKGSSRTAAAAGADPPIVSPDTGMVLYPAYTSKGIAVSTEFNPAIKFGGKINVQSSQQPASGPWIVYSLDHDLETLVYNGQWFTRIEAARPGFGPVISGPA